MESIWAERVAFGGVPDIVDAAWPTRGVTGG